MRPKVARCGLIIGFVCAGFAFVTFDGEGFFFLLAAVAFACTALFGKGDWRLACVFLFAVSLAVGVVELRGLLQANARLRERRAAKKEEIAAARKFLEENGDKFILPREIQARARSTEAHP